MSNDWISIKEAANLCGVSRQWLYDHRRDGLGPPRHKRAFKDIYLRREVLDWIERQRIVVAA